MKNFTFLFFLLLFVSARAQPDSSGIISGRVIDSASAKPVIYATVSLVKQPGNKVVEGTITDDRGEFTLNNLGNGLYKVVIGFIGYENKEITATISPSKQHLRLGSISLISQQHMLQEVVVTAQKALVENKIDKIVYNAERDVTSQTGVAADVLKKVPQVTVDVDGNVELLGNSNIRFLINGKPSTIFGNNIADVLQSIPANQIQSIEVITSPGAKYDAQGTGGIINIILKKSTAEGINGSTSLSAGTRFENGSFNLNTHHGHFGTHMYISGNGQLPSTTLNSQDRVSTDAELVQNGTSRFSRSGFQSGAGFDWEITPKDNLSGSLGYYIFENSSSGANARSSAMMDSSDNRIVINDLVNISNKYNQHTLDWSLHYVRKFNRKDQQLEIIGQSSFGDNYAHYLQTQQYIASGPFYSGSYGNNTGTNDETNITVDYIQPNGEDAIFEAGLKTTINPLSNISGIYLLDAASDAYTYSDDRSSSLNYRSDIYAAYLSEQFKPLSWLDMKAGLRYERTVPTAYFSNAGNVLISSYGTYVPSVILSHTFENHQTLKLSYSHRIERPGYRDLNPFINASDPKNLSTGNTSLRPEVGDKIELNFNKIFEQGTNINTTLFYRGNRDDIQSYIRFYDTYAVGDYIYTNVAVTTRENVGREDNYGLSIYGSVPVSSKLNFRTNLSGFQRYITNGELPGKNVQGFNYRLNATATYTMNNSLIVEFFANFNSPRINTQGTYPAFTSYNAALRKQFLNRKASIAITATNFFSQYVKQETKLTGDNFTLDNIRNLPYQSFGVNLTYRFGKLKFKKEKEAEDPNLTNPPEVN